MESTTFSTEIMKYEVDDTSRTDKTSLRSAMQTLHQAPGSNRTSSGFEVQDPNNMFVINVWDSVKDSNTFHADESSSTKFNQSISACTSRPLWRYNVELSCEPFTALSAPLTEIVLWTVKHENMRERTRNLLIDLMKVVNAIPKEEGMYKAGWGPITESKDHFVVMIGWTTMEAFHTAVRNSEKGRAILAQLAEVTDRDLKHTEQNIIL